MRGYSGWSYLPFLPYNRIDKVNNPHICSVSPYENGVKLGIINAEKCKITITGDGFEEKTVKTVQNRILNINNLAADTGYSVFVETDKGKSPVRKFRTGAYPGSVVSYLHPEDEAYIFSGRYLGSPSIVILPDKRLLASMDVFAGKEPQKLTQIFESADGGKTWTIIAELNPCFWGKLFIHKDALYMLSTSSEYGDLLIGKSYDFGRSWTKPTVIMRGSAGSCRNGFHKAPVRIERYNGRLVTAVEFGSWEEGGFYNAVLSIDEEDDLLNEENWLLSMPYKTDISVHREAPEKGVIEGNIICIGGALFNILRAGDGKALILRVSDSFDKLEYFDTVDFPCGHSKFELFAFGDTIYAVGNALPGRNVLALYMSKNINSWELADKIIDGSGYDMAKVGFQYPSVALKNNELFILSRTAFNGANTFHNSNCITFHKYSLP